METGIVADRFWYADDDGTSCVYDPHSHRMELIEATAGARDAAEVYAESVAETPDEPAPDIRRRHWVRNLKLSLSGRCNLACDYCFRSAVIPELVDESIATRAIDAMVNDFGRDAPSYCINFNLTSEPLLQAPLLDRLLTYAERVEAACGKTIYWYVLTSGTLLSKKTDRVMRRLLERTGRLVVSIDGPPEVHDRHRVFLNGGGTHESLMRFIRTFRDSVGAVDAESVITADYPWPWRVVEYLAELGFSKISTRPEREHRPEAAPAADAFDCFLPGYDELFAALRSRIDQGDFRAFTALRHDHALRPLWRLLPGFKTTNRCFWGLTHIVVDGAGRYFTCDGMIGNETFQCGDLDSGVNWERFHQSVNVALRTPCSTCWARYACGGTCYLKGVHADGDPLTVDPAECRFNEYLVSRNLELLARAKKRPGAVAGLKDALIRN